MACGLIPRVASMLDRLERGRDPGPEGPAWAAVHVGLGEQEGRLLRERIVPCLSDAFRAGSVDRFFFVRYRAGEPHLRVRLRGEEEPRERVTARVEDIALEAIEETEGSAFGLHRAPYEREVERYGGARGLEVCEAFFMVSSLRVRSVLAVERDGREETPMRVRLPRAAADLVLMARHAWGDRDRAVRFLDTFSRLWTVPRRIGRGGEADRLRERRRTVMEERAARVGRSVREHLRGWWEDPTATAEEMPDDPGDEASLPAPAWVGASGRLLDELQRRGVDFATREGGRTLSGLMHMNNNRYALENIDEAYIALLSARVLDGADP